MAMKTTLPAATTLALMTLVTQLALLIVVTQLARVTVIIRMTPRNPRILNLRRKLPREMEFPSV